MAKARQIMGGLVLAPSVAGFTARHRGGMRALVRQVVAVNQHLPRPADIEARIRAHRARVVAEDPGPEPPRCWGVCGRTLPRSAAGGVAGWWSRRVRCGAGEVVELHCPECFHRWGWIEPRAEA